MPLKYLDLEPDRREIRVLTIQPGDFDEPIEATLSTKSLNDHPVYEAISYVWGDEKIKRKIHINGIAVDITVNLALALSYIKLEHRPRIVWTDAICINQSNPLEKNAQVSMMGSIYKNCTQCLVWLGEEDEDNVDDVYNVYDTFDFIKQIGHGHVDLSGCAGAPCRSKMGTMSRLMRRPWWDRTWTIQESLLPPRVTFLCGTNSLGAEHFLEAFLNLATHLGGGCCPYPSCETCFEAVGRYYSKLPGLIPQPSSQKLNSLLGRMTMYRDRMVSDPRDKVYAVLSLISESQPAGIVVDYGISPLELYTKAFLEDIRLHQSLNSFGLVLRKQSDSSPSDYPSWLPNWNLSVENEEHLILASWLSRYDLFNASKSRLPSFVLTCNNRILLISSLMIDKIRQKGKMFPVSKARSEQIEVMKDWSILLLGTSDLDIGSESNTMSFWTPSLTNFISAASPARYIAGGATKEAFWRTLVMDHKPSGDSGEYKRYGPNDGRIFWAAWNFLCFNKPVTGNFNREEIGDTMGSLAGTVAAKQIFITESGYFGNGPVGARPGDEIHIIAGGKCPLMLRPVVERPSNLTEALKSYPAYTLVGDCYLHGIMDGEAADGFEERSSKILIL